jgi:hypothetical protein
MSTWVLVIVLVANGTVEPRGITSISGYHSKVECMVAADALSREKMLGDETSLMMFSRCIPGPEK